MDTFLAIASRRDERRYRPEPLQAGTVERILDAGRLSGSARNRQPWLFVIPESDERRAELAASVYVPENVLTASFVVCVAVTGRGPVAFDAGRATQNMLLAAWNEGVSSCPNGLADAERASRALELSEDEVPQIVLSFGLPGRTRAAEERSPAEWSERANRRPLVDVVRRLS
ncbi:MAG: nitroreductase family protein [Gaiella sp.]